MIEWIAENQNWFLEGLGVFLLGLIVSFIVWLIKRDKTPSNGNISQSMGNRVKANKVTFTKNKQIIGKDMDLPEE